MYWTKDKPTEPGWYWYYGYVFGNWPGGPEEWRYHNCRKEYFMVKCNKISNGVMCTMGAAFLYDYEPLNGYFHKVDPPGAPEIKVKEKKDGI